MSSEPFEGRIPKTAIFDQTDCYFMPQKRVLLVDDHQLIIDGLRGFIETNPDYKVVGEANNGVEAIRLASVLNPDVILMDIEMPEMSGIQACEEIKKIKPETKIIIVSMHHEKQLIRKLIDQGADGYLLKNSQQQEVMEAIVKALNNEPYFSEEVNQVLSEKNSPKTGSTNSEISLLSQLTEREIEILKLVAQGMTNKEVGDALDISHRTVDTHRTNLMKKLDVTNVAGLIRIAFKNGLIN
ncbi:MAG: response regulator transcription factor [Crocinitomicaceae bacterium]|nr:response regulator transcription factor [Crocinitomicaceae bacterium]